MNLFSLLSLAPLIILAATPVIVMIAVAIRRNHGDAFVISLGGIGLTLLSLPGTSDFPGPTGPLLRLDGFAFFFVALLLLAGVATLFMAFGYLRARVENPEEFYILILTALFGGVLLVCSIHLAALLMGLEILSVSLYALIAYDRTNESGLEAGIKYLVLAAFSSAFLLFGMALVYAETGALSFSALAAKLATDDAGMVLPAGAILIAVGIGFKLAVVPFHMWVADVFEGSPAPVTAFVATVSKGAVFALLLRLFATAGTAQGGALPLLVAAGAVASMVAGNLLALFQRNVKRLLAYSSIAHMGYLLVAFLAAGPLRVTAVVFYLTAYFIATLGAFGVVTLLLGPGRDSCDLEEYRGLFFQRPWVAGAFTVMLLSLAGIPLTAGFIGKFAVLTAAVGSFLAIPVAALVATSVVGLFYYLRVLVALYTVPLTAATRVPAFPMPAGAVLLAFLTALLLGLGLFPGPLLQAIPVLGALG